MIQNVAQSLPRAQSSSSGAGSAAAAQSSSASSQKQGASTAPYNPKDPSNDAAAESLVGESQLAAVSK